MSERKRHGSDSDEQPASYRRVIIAVASSNILAVLPVFLLGAVAVFVREDLGFTEQALGASVSIYYGASALSSVVGGKITERLGAGPSLRLAAVTSALSAVLVATVARSWLSLTLSLLFAAFGNAVAQPAANLALAREVRPKQQGYAFGLKQSAGPGAVLIAGLAVPTIALTVGWRWAYLLALLFAATTWMFAPPNRPVQRLDKADRRTGDLSKSPLILLSVAIVLAVAGASALNAFYVESAVHHGHGTGAAGLWLTMGSAASIIVRIIVGRWADRRVKGYMKMVNRMLILGAVGFVLLGYASPVWVLVPATILAFAAGWGWPGLYQFAIVRLNPAAPAEATGVVMVGMFAGGMIGPITFGSLVEHVSYTAAWWTLAGALIAGAGLTRVALRWVRSDIKRLAAVFPTPSGLNPPGDAGRS